MFIFHTRCALLANLPCSPPFRVTDPALVSCPDLLYGPVGPFLFLLADRFQRTFIPSAIFQAFSSTHKVALSSERQTSDSHACGY
ncbi:unnamed protein product [Protopolystoma xenopodis]|uniref:Uncharacterized protein n=1 Tax=Protopolystoma xenopodis TaxID=117903 RepID=A0A448XBL6_9PLAT|nr:unnamed protein product [Protopolystoma xenopodis]